MSLVFTNDSIEKIIENHVKELYSNKTGFEYISSGNFKTNLYVDGGNNDIVCEIENTDNLTEV